MEKFEIRLGFASPNFKFFHNPYSPSAEYEAIFSITRHQPGGICTNIITVYCMPSCILTYVYSFSLLKRHLVRGGGVFYDVYIMTCYFSLTVHRAVLKITILSE